MSLHAFSLTAISENRYGNTLSSIFSKRTAHCILLVTEEWDYYAPFYTMWGRFVFTHGTVPSYQVFTIDPFGQNKCGAVLPLTKEAMFKSQLLNRRATWRYEVPLDFRSKFLHSFNANGE